MRIPAISELSTTPFPMKPDSDKLWRSFTRSKGLFLIAGPCVIESEDLCLRIASFLNQACNKLGMAFIFKASYDKANRSSSESFRGPGIDEGLKILAKVKAELGLPVLTDIHTEEQAQAAAQVVDVLQIPALLCRQTDLIQAAVRTGRIVNLKKGQFLSPLDMKQVVRKAETAGGKQIVVTERGAMFGYNNLVADMRSIAIMRQFGYPVVFDATHSVQLPGGAGTKSSGQGEFAPVLAQAAVAAGANGVFIETHPEPKRALSDGPNMIPLADLPHVLRTLRKVHAAIQ